jgi:hypothetical protein
MDPISSPRRPRQQGLQASQATTSIASALQESIGERETEVPRPYALAAPVSAPPCVATVTVSCEMMLMFKIGLNETIFGRYEIFPKQKGIYVCGVVPN